MKKFVCLAMVCLLSILSFSAVSFAAPNKVLKVATDATFPPFESVNEKGVLEGFDIDIIKAIGEAAGYDVQISNVSWDGLIPGLMAGNYNCLIAAMTITDERKNAINFSEPYFNAGQAIATLKSNDSITTPSDLSGKKVAVQMGTTGDFESTAMKNVTVKRFNTIPEAFQELKNGGVAAVVVDYGVAIEFAQQFDYITVNEPFTNDEYYGIGISKKDTTLLKDINEGLEKIKASGKYDEIYNKYFSF